MIDGDLRGDNVLDPAQGAALVEFARACRGAARAVALYPVEHPAIAAALSRLADLCAAPASAASWRLGVSPGALQLDGRRLAKADSAATELAELLHAHHIGALVIGSGADADLWLKFLRLLAAQPEDLQRQGGLARLWTAMGGRQIEIREVDYASVLRERRNGARANWDEIVRHCLEGDSVCLDDEAVKALAELAADPDRLLELVQRLQRAGERSGVRSAAVALLTMLRSVMQMLAEHSPTELEPVLDSIAGAACRFPLEFLAQLLASPGVEGVLPGLDVRAELLKRFTDAKVAAFVAESVSASGAATPSLASAFFALVPEPDRRVPILALARDRVPPGRLGVGDDGDRAWQDVEELLGDCPDDAHVSADYARELATARSRAGDIESIADDPPERIAAWIATVADGSVRALDHQLLLDLLAVENDPGRWREVVDVVVAHVEDLLLVGDFPAADRLVSALAAAADPHQPASSTEAERIAREAAAREGLDRVVALLTRSPIVRHLEAMDDGEVACVEHLCLALGARAIGPLAELLAAEQKTRARRRLTDLLVAFGPAGRQCAEQLKHSSNASVRRVAVYLLREYGGSEALPDLASLLDDAEPHVQRAAVRAILLIGSDDAYSVLERALRAHPASREAILRLLETDGDERAAPLFAHIVRRGDCRRGLRTVYVKAIASLGRLGGDEAVDALKQALYRGEWWAPRRTAELRAAAAAALSQLDTPIATGVLRQAAERGPRGVRAAARARLSRRP